SVVLALLAGGLGVLLALWGSRVLVALAPNDVPRLSETAIDSRVLWFALAASLAASVLFGLAPALQALRIDLNQSLKQSSTRAARAEALPIACGARWWSPKSPCRSSCWRPPAFWSRALWLWRTCRWDFELTTSWS